MDGTARDGEVTQPAPYPDSYERMQSSSNSYVPVPARFSANGQEPSAPGPRAASALGTVPTGVGGDTLSGGVAGSTLANGATADRGQGYLSADGGNDDAESEPRRSSSLRRSSFVTTPRALSGLGLRGCLPRRSSAPESGIRSGSGNSSMRLLRGSRSSTPQDSPRVTPSRSRSRRKGGRHASNPPEPATDAVRGTSAPPPGHSAPIGAAGKAPVPTNGTSTPTLVDENVTGNGGAPQGGAQRGNAHLGDVQSSENVLGSSKEGIASKKIKKEPPVEPEAVVASSVSMRGLLECGRAMRMDGTFVGQLKSTGSITIGPSGQVTGDLKGLKFLRVEGLVVGDVVCDTVMVLEKGKILGDISAGSLTLGPETTVKGRITVVKDPSKLLPEESKSKKGTQEKDAAEEQQSNSKPKPKSRKSRDAKEEMETQVPGTGTKSEDQAPSSTTPDTAEEVTLAQSPVDILKDGRVTVSMESKKVASEVVGKLEQQRQGDLGKHHAFSDDESQGSEIEGDGDGEDDDSGTDRVRRSTAAIEVKLQEQSAGQMPPKKSMDTDKEAEGLGIDKASLDVMSPPVKGVAGMAMKMGVRSDDKPLSAAQEAFGVAS